MTVDRGHKPTENLLIQPKALNFRELNDAGCTPLPLAGAVIGH